MTAGRVLVGMVGRGILVNTRTLPTQGTAGAV